MNTNSVTGAGDERYHRQVTVLIGVNPIREALKAGRPLDRVLIAKGAGGPRLQEIIDLCRQNGVTVRFEPRDALERASANKNHQGIVAFGAATQYANQDSVIANAKMIVVLDGVEDPHNLGAIVR